MEGNLRMARKKTNIRTRCKCKPKATAVEDGVPPSTPPAGTRTWSTQSIVLPGGALGSKVSELDNITSKFSQAVIIENDEAFTLKPLVLTEGPSAGRRVLMLVKNVTFLDLPGEVRNKIWDEVLETNKIVEIGVTFGRPPDRLYQFRSPWGAHSTARALARTSKQISAEVLAIVYGCNTFEFGNLEHLARFAARIGPISCSRIRHVGIMHPDGLRSTLSPDPWKSIVSFTNLRSLTINHATVYLNALPQPGRMRMLDLFKSLKPFLYAWRNANEDRGDSSDVLDLVNFMKRDFCGNCREEIKGAATKCGEYSCRGQGTSRLGPKHVKVVSDRLRELIAEEFGLVRVLKAED